MWFRDLPSPLPYTARKCPPPRTPEVRGGTRGRVRGGGGERVGREGLAVHTPGGAHTRWSVAIAGVLLFKGGAGTGPRVEKSEASVERSDPKRRFGGPHTRRCIHKAMHTQGGLWPPQESCYLRGVWGLAPALSEARRLSSVASRSEGLAVHTQGNAYTRQCTHKAVCGHRRSLVISGGRESWPSRRAQRAEGYRGFTGGGG